MDNEILKKKACGIMNSIEKMSSEERKGPPTRVFGEDYNGLHSLVLESNPGLAAVLPPPVKIVDAPGKSFSRQPYSEIHSFCSQIYQLL